MDMGTHPKVPRTTGQLIRHYREQRGLNQSELARRLGIRPQSVQEWEAETTVPSARRLPAIADTLGVETRDLAPGAPLRVEHPVTYPQVLPARRSTDRPVEIPPPPPLVAGPSAVGARIQVKPAPGTDVVQIMRVGNGSNSEADVSMLVVSPQWAATRFPGRDPHAIRVLDVRGDAMAPTLCSGDWVFVDTSALEVDLDALWVFVLQGRRGREWMIRRVQRRTDGSWLLLQDNDRYPPEAVDPAAQHRLEVAGVVCGRHVFTPM